MAVTDVGPQGEARAAIRGFELPPHIEIAPGVFKQRGGVGSLHRGLGNAWGGSSDGGELHGGSNRAQVSVGVEGSPLAQMRRVGKGLPDFFRRMAEFSGQNECPRFFVVLSAVLLYSRYVSGARCVVLAIGHLSTLTFVAKSSA
jgi:hypothetical protein